MVSKESSRSVCTLVAVALCGCAVVLSVWIAAPISPLAGAPPSSHRVE